MSGSVDVLILEQASYQVRNMERRIYTCKMYVNRSVPVSFKYGRIRDNLKRFKNSTNLLKV